MLFRFKNNILKPYQESQPAHRRISRNLEQTYQDFKKEVGEFARYLKATPPSEGSAGVFYPGEVEYIREQQRKAAGIEIEDATWEKLRALAGDYKLAAELDLA